jgi:Domain of unknown function DUF29
MSTTSADLHDRDFYAWTREQAAALRELAAQRWNGPLDLERLAEEIEDVGSERRDGVESQLVRLIEHLLKLEHSPSDRPRRQWLITVRSARMEADKRLTRAIRNEIEPRLPALYDDVRYMAAQALADYGEDEAASALPAACPYTLDQLLDRGWLPANRHGLTDKPV